jgi:hypothetical protein
VLIQEYEALAAGKIMKLLHIILDGEKKYRDLKIFKINLDSKDIFL